MTDSHSEAVVWIMVDQRAKAKTFAAVAEHLKKSKIHVEIVTITEVIGSVAKGAITGGAERLLRGLRVAVKGSSDEDLVGAVQKARPDVLAVTDARYVRALGLLESLTGLKMLQLGVFKDYDFDPEWSRSGVQGFVVPSEAHVERLVSAGVSRERILCAGPAIQAPFARELDREAVRGEFGFGEDHVVLVRASGIPSALLDKLVFQMTLVETPIRAVFHHDGDGATASVLRKASSQYGLRALMFGHVEDLERYFLSADLVVSAADDSYVPEIVALDTPLLFVGDESAAGYQVDFLAREGAARHIGDLLRLGTEMDKLLSDDALAQAREAAAKISSTSGSEDVAQAIATAVEKRVEWHKAPATDGGGGTDDAPATEEPPGGGAFEVIGGGGVSVEDASGSRERSESSPESDYSGISRAEAQNQLAALIMTERDLERKVDELERQQQRWRDRLELAREWKEEDLANEAESVLRGYMKEADEVGSELSGLRKQKERVKMAAGGGTPSSGGDGHGDAAPLSKDMEKRFRKMEIDSDLNDLKDRLRKELGE